MPSRPARRAEPAREPRDDAMDARRSDASPTDRRADASSEDSAAAFASAFGMSARPAGGSGWVASRWGEAGARCRKDRRTRTRRRGPLDDDGGAHHRRRRRSAHLRRGGGEGGDP